MLIVAKICILMHCSSNFYANVMVIKIIEWNFMVVVILQILSGKIPFLTKGPWALFFGGKEILHELSNAKPGRHLPYLYLISIIFNLVIFGIIPKG